MNLPSDGGEKVIHGSFKLHKELMKIGLASHRMYQAVPLLFSCLLYTPPKPLAGTELLQLDRLYGDWKA